MSLLMRPGSALLVLAVMAFFGRYLVGGVPLIGGTLSYILWFATVFGVIGGVFLLFMGRRTAEDA